MSESLGQKIQHIIFDFDGVLYAPTEWPKKELNTELVSWIRDNRDKYTFSILSNSGSFLTDMLKNQFEIYDDFDHVFNSSEIGHLKPNREIFEHVLHELGVRSEECLFIDDLSANIEAARTLGFNTHLYRTDTEFFQLVESL